MAGRRIRITESVRPTRALITVNISQRDRRLLIVAGICAILLALFWRPIQRRILIFIVVQSETVAQPVVDELASDLSDPANFLQALWDTRKIPHRIAAANYLSAHAGSDPTLASRMAPVMKAAVTDGDLEVREVALRFFGFQHRSDAVPSAKEQLSDHDPAARLLALRYLHQTGNSSLIPFVAPLLENASPEITSLAAATLRQWIGTSEGQTTRSDELNGAPSVEKMSLESWRNWWNQHKSDYPPSALIPQRQPLDWRLPTADFSLRDLDEKSVSLSDFKGKVVLITFWDQATPACLPQLTALAELYKRLPDQAEIVAVSLDTTIHERSCGHEMDRPSNTEVRELKEDLRQFAKEHRLPYQLLIDRTGAIGRRFNACELPLTVLIDANGYVRRRFSGLRSSDVLEKLANDLRSKPL